MKKISNIIKESLIKDHAQYGKDVPENELLDIIHNAFDDNDSKLISSFFPSKNDLVILNRKENSIYTINSKQDLEDCLGKYPNFIKKLRNLQEGRTIVIDNIIIVKV